MYQASSLKIVNIPVYVTLLSRIARFRKILYELSLRRQS